MATEVTLPALGESVTEGTITRWLKNVGDTVAVDEPLVEISTDKVDTEIPSPVAGIILEIKAQEDDTIEIGAPLVVIGAAGDAPVAAASVAEAPAAPAPAAAPPAPVAPAPTPVPTPVPVAAAPTPVAAPAQPEATADNTPTAGGTEVVLPALGESVTEGTVMRWLKAVGDTVAVDEGLLEISTDKVDTEIPSPMAGTLLAQKVAEDETVEVGAVLAVIGAAGASAAPVVTPDPEPAAIAAAATDATIASPVAPAPVAPAPVVEAPAAPAAAAPVAPAAPIAPSTGASSYVTPLVRKVAADNGVDLATVTGSGVGGRIRKEDVLAAAAAKSAPAGTPAADPAPAAVEAPSPLRGKTEPMSRLRTIIANQMVTSLQTAAQVTQVVEVDVTSIAKIREARHADFEAREGVKLTYTAFFAKAVVDSLRVHPKLNAGIDLAKGEINYYDRENLSITVDTEAGQISPVIKDAGDLSVSGLAKKIADVAARSRSLTISPDELSGGTFTLTNTGSTGALFETPIINTPQAAILGAGVVVKRPVVLTDPVLGDTVGIRHMVYLALTYDHRLIDGADAGRFLVDVQDRLESGNFDV
ncbi:dihydrolipoamide acetyltransferase component of pyruvate dehydrogenase complex [Nocardioides baekrokdamisoli]|uniref:Dihydrolipoamide acetyltransferase component of pyruvate dehydrogenase complex n=1 Tax=Nocardioides baekrokdamisoli TaxID=1804624 RepID=A0A3G9IBV9_9ACTN|nr:2-oxoglutarate dehydrogenase, E2 component, dihydrolipoamide succinyltransferase [Nocardioides baekrokdamisoli]BBH15822.1 dihydrolipoamide acetyltransferase component of pyruvate dehydrogenase complex [Nocardioides baekrokdamisoli]